MTFESNKEKVSLNCIFQQDTIISFILNFRYEISSKEIENYLIISSNNGIINILSYENYKTLYILDVFQSKGVYHLIQSKTEENTFFASSWGCFKKIKLFHSNLLLFFKITKKNKYIIY